MQGVHTSVLLGRSWGLPIAATTALLDPVRVTRMTPPRQDKLYPVSYIAVATPILSTSSGDRPHDML